MKTLLPFVAFALILGMVLIFVRVSKSGSQSKRNPYQKVEALLTPAERSFYGVLEQALDPRYRLFAKVRVADVISVRPRPNQAAFNRISAKHFDFVICDAARVSVLCVIELNDRSHARKKTKERDAFLTGVCSDVGLPLLTFPAKANYVVAEVRESLMSVLQTSAEPSEVPLDESLVRAEKLVPVCPKCSSSMTRRTIKTGSKAGTIFWSCSRFPDCTGVNLNA